MFFLECVAIALFILSLLLWMILTVAVACAIVYVLATVPFSVAIAVLEWLQSKRRVA